MEISLFQQGLRYLICGLVLAGCAETYVRPDAPVPQAWPEGVSAAGNRLAAEIDWRTFFPDVRLQVLIETALEHNRDLRIATARIEEARAVYGIAKSEQIPALGIAGGLESELTPRSVTGSGQALETRRYDLGISVVSFELDFWGRLSGLADAARASYLATEEARRSVRLTLISEVATAYYSLLEVDERLAISRAALESLEQSQALVKLAKEAGYASAFDNLQANSAVETARAGLATLQRDRAAAANYLQFIVGRPQDRLPTGGSLAQQALVGDLAAGLPADILVARPDVLAAEQRLIAAHANIGAARAAFLPKILLTGLFGTASKALTGLFAAGSSAWSFKPSLSLPLFDGGRLAGSTDIAEARKVVAVAEYEKTIQQAFWEAANLLSARDAFVEQLRSAEANVKIFEERYQVAQHLFKGGQISYLNVLDAQREYYAMQQTVVQVRRAQLTATAQLYKALGGGGES